MRRLIVSIGFMLLGGFLGIVPYLAILRRFSAEENHEFMFCLLAIHIFEFVIFGLPTLILIYLIMCRYGKIPERFKYSWLPFLMGILRWLSLFIVTMPFTIVFRIGKFYVFYAWPYAWPSRWLLYLALSGLSSIAAGLILWGCVFLIARRPRKNV